jgi:hypothetical protein
MNQEIELLKQGFDGCFDQCGKKVILKDERKVAEFSGTGTAVLGGHCSILARPASNSLW